MDQTVTMPPADWQMLVTLLANAQGPGVSWATVNPLLQKLGEQLRVQEAGQPQRRFGPQPPNGLDEEELGMDVLSGNPIPRRPSRTPS